MLAVGFSLHELTTYQWCFTGIVICIVLLAVAIIIGTWSKDPGEKLLWPIIALVTGVVMLALIFVMYVLAPPAEVKSEVEPTSTIQPTPATPPAFPRPFL